MNNLYWCAYHQLECNTQLLRIRQKTITKFGSGWHCTRGNAVNNSQMTMKINWCPGWTRPESHLPSYSLRSWYCLALGGRSNVSLEDQFGGQVHMFGRSKGAMPQYSRVLPRHPCQPKFQQRDCTSVFFIVVCLSAVGRALPASLLSGTPLCHSEGTFL